MPVSVASVSEQESSIRSSDYPCATRDLSKPASYAETRFTLNRVQRKLILTSTSPKVIFTSPKKIFHEFFFNICFYFMRPV